MPGSYTTENNHWRDRIAARIDRGIEVIVADDPGFMARLRCDARKRALESLSLAERQAELDAIATQRQELEKRERATRRAILARVRGVAIETIEEGWHFRSRDHEVEGAIDKRQAVHEEEVLAADKVGRETLKLRIERERLLDVVWLVTSSVQVRASWWKVSELLDEGPTQLERKAMTSSRRRPWDDRGHRCVRSRTVLGGGLGSLTGDIELRRDRSRSPVQLWQNCGR